jgi:hypothetical protein
VLYEGNPNTLIPVYLDFPENCWTLDGTKFITLTPNEIENVLLIFSIGFGNPPSCNLP